MGELQLDINSPIEMALAYAAHDWPVFPLHTCVEGICDCRKPCGRDAGKHPRTIAGFKDASTDEQVVRRWWGMWPSANIGIPTGHVSGLLVIDIDPRNGGLETVERLREQGITFPRTAQVLTQGDGFHLLYAMPERGGKIKVKLGDGIDLKGPGGYIVAPPSVGPRGKYVWQVAMEPVGWN